MNKELIKKHKAEFDHWLNGGKLLAKHNNKGWINYYGEDIWTHSAETLIVIDDEYSMFRKALIEGESIEVLQTNTERWVNIGTIIESIKPELYRIKPNKPEEPKFKVGDWVRNRINEIGQILQEDYKGKGLYKISNTHALKCEVGTSAKDLTIWVPKKGDWCWFSIKNRIPTIGQFLSIEADGNRKYSATFPNTPHPFITYYDYCEPFIGNLPTLSNK